MICYCAQIYNFNVSKKYPRAECTYFYNCLCLGEHDLSANFDTYPDELISDVKRINIYAEPCSSLIKKQTNLLALNCR